MVGERVETTSQGVSRYTPRSKKSSLKALPSTANISTVNISTVNISTVNISTVNNSITVNFSVTPVTKEG